MAIKYTSSITFFLISIHRKHFENNNFVVVLCSPSLCATTVQVTQFNIITFVTRCLYLKIVVNNYVEKAIGSCAAIYHYFLITIYDSVLTIT